MTDTTKIPHTELMRDRDELLADITVCQSALDMGVTTYGNGKSVQERLWVDQDKVAKVDAELARRLKIASKDN